MILKKYQMLLYSFLNSTTLYNGSCQILHIKLMIRRIYQIKKTYLSETSKTECQS